MEALAEAEVNFRVAEALAAAQFQAEVDSEQVVVPREAAVQVAVEVVAYQPEEAQLRAGVVQAAQPAAEALLLAMAGRIHHLR